MTQEQAVKTIKEICKMAIDHDWMPAWRIVDACAMALHPRIDTPPGNDSVRASTGFQRDGGDKTERRCMANQCVICGAEMPEGDQVCGHCRRQHGY